MKTTEYWIEYDNIYNIGILNTRIKVNDSDKMDDENLEIAAPSNTKYIKYMISEENITFLITDDRI